MAFSRIIKISHTNNQAEIRADKIDLVGRVLDFEECGYEYDKTEDLVKTPDQKIYSESDIEKILTPMQFGNKKQLKILEALEYLQLARKYLAD